METRMIRASDSFDAFSVGQPFYEETGKQKEANRRREGGGERGGKKREENANVGSGKVGRRVQINSFPALFPLSGPPPASCRSQGYCSPREESFGVLFAFDTRPNPRPWLRLSARQFSFDVAGTGNWRFAPTVLRVKRGRSPLRFAPAKFKGNVTPRRLPCSVGEVSRVACRSFHPSIIGEIVGSSRELVERETQDWSAREFENRGRGVGGSGPKCMPPLLRAFREPSTRGNEWQRFDFQGSSRDAQRRKLAKWKRVGDMQPRCRREASGYPAPSIIISR